MNGYKVAGAPGRRATGRRSSCSPPRPGSTTRPKRSTPAPTTSCRSRSRSWCSSLAFAPLLRRGHAEAAHPPRRAPWCSTRTRALPTPRRRGAPDGPGVRRPRGAAAPPGRRRVQAGDPRRGVGCRVPRRPEHRRGLHPVPAQEARRSLRPRHDRDRAFGRLPGGERGAGRGGDGAAGLRTSRGGASVRFRITLLATALVDLADPRRLLLVGAVERRLTENRRTPTGGSTRGVELQAGQSIEEALASPGRPLRVRARRRRARRRSSGRP